VLGPGRADSRSWSPQNHVDRPLDVGGESDAQTSPQLRVPERSLPQICARCALETVGLATLRHGGLAPPPRFGGSKKHTAVPAESLRDRDAEALLALAHEKAKRSDAIVRSDQPEEPAEEEDEQVDLLQILRRSLGPANTARPKAQRRAKAPAQARPRSRGRATRAHR
jgi:hypothetical protein